MLDEVARCGWKGLTFLSFLAKQSISQLVHTRRGFLSGWTEAEYKLETLLDNIFGEGDLTKLPQTFLKDFKIFEDVVCSFLSTPAKSTCSITSC